MESVSTLRLSLGFLSAPFPGLRDAFTFPWAKAFNGDTHRYVTERGLALVSEISEHKNNISSDDKKYFNIIGDYSLKPDEDEI